MKADLKRVLNFLIIATSTIFVLIITFDCITMINIKFQTESVLNLLVGPLKVIGFIDLLIFVPSILLFGYIYINKYRTENIKIDWNAEPSLELARS